MIRLIFMQVWVAPQAAWEALGHEVVRLMRGRPRPGVGSGGEDPTELKQLSATLKRLLDEPPRQEVRFGRRAVDPAGGSRRVARGVQPAVALDRPGCRRRTDLVPPN